MAADSKHNEVYLAIVKTVDGKFTHCFIHRGGHPENGWVIASMTPDMESAIWFASSNVISIELHAQEG